LGALTGLTWMLVCNNPGLCGDVPAGVTPTTSGDCPTALGGTLLGSDCPSSPPTGSPTSSPTSAPPTIISYPSKPCCSDVQQHGNLNCIFHAMGIPQQDINEHWCISSC